MKFFYETKKHEKKRKDKALDIANKLKKAEETLFIVKKAAESSPNAIVLADPEGNHFYHNKAFTQLFGYTPEELHAIVDEPTIYANKDTAKIVFDTIRGRFMDRRSRAGIEERQRIRCAAACRCHKG
jgi:PAS domain-containing protein